MNKDHIRKATILIVDDTPENLGVLYEYLAGIGFTVLVAQSGEDALELLEETIPDIILMDILMPGIDGFETCRRIKKIDALKDIPLLFVSSLSDTVDKVRGFQAGGVDYISKPIQQEETLARITTHLNLYILKKELKEKNKLLEIEIKERKRAEKASEIANQAKSEFLAHMSHEFRTPLNGILGYAQILKRDRNLNESQKKGINIIERSGNHLLNLINEMLDLSKIEAQKMELSISDLNLMDFLNVMVEMVHIHAQKKSLSFKFIKSDNLPSCVLADEKRLSQILLNILSNAVKYTEQGGIVFLVKNPFPKQYA